MDLATWRTTILSSWNSIAASMYIIRGEKFKRGGGREGGVCLKFSLYAQKIIINEIAAMITTLEIKTVLNRKNVHYMLIDTDW